MRVWVFLSLFLVWCMAFAESQLPSGCQAVAVSGEAVTLKTEKKGLFLIHNVSESDLWITHSEENPGANAGWTIRIQPDHWSALALDKPPFVLNCIESRPGHEQQIPCEGAIAACQWKQVKFPSGTDGTFWAAEDAALPVLTAALGGRGFKIPE